MKRTKPKAGVRVRHKGTKPSELARLMQACELMKSAGYVPVDPKHPEGEWKKP